MTETARLLDNGKWMLCQGCTRKFDCSKCIYSNGTVVETVSLDEGVKRLVADGKDRIEKIKKTAERGVISLWEAEQMMMNVRAEVFEYVPYSNYEAWEQHKKMSRSIWSWLMKNSK